MSTPTRNGNKAHLEIVPFSLDSTSEGCMVFPGSPPRIVNVKRSAENSHFFMYNHQANRFEVLRYGSALIVNLLMMYEPEDPSVAAGNRTKTSQRELAVFDTEGNFHDQLLLQKLVPAETGPGDPDVRHTAFFQRADAKAKESIEIAIDNIYNFSLALPKT